MSFLIDENGQGMVEYALLIGLVAVISIIVIFLMGDKIKALFNKANKALDNAE